MHLNYIKEDMSIEKVDPLQLGINPKPVDKALIRRYIKYVRNRTSTPQLDKTIFKKYALKPAKTGLGKSRLPRVSVAGVRYGVMGLPHAKGGRRSNVFNLNSQEIKFNKKEKTLAIENCFRWLLEEGKIFICDYELNSLKTKDFLKTLRVATPELAEACLRATLKVVATKAPEDHLAKAAKNFNGTKLLTNKNNHFYYLVQGFRTHYLITTKAYFQQIVQNYFLKCLSN